MARADYYLCDVCGAKAFYDADIRDRSYIAVWDRSEEEPAIAIAVLCSDCARTHEIVVQPKAAGSNEPKAGGKV